MNAAVNFSHYTEVLLLRVKHPLMQQHTPLRRRTDRQDLDAEIRETEETIKRVWWGPCFQTGVEL